MRDFKEMSKELENYISAFRMCHDYMGDEFDVPNEIVDGVIEHIKQIYSDSNKDIKQRNAVRDYCEIAKNSTIVPKEDADWIGGEATLTTDNYVILNWERKKL